MTSPSDLPRITKRELIKVGIRMPYEDNVRDWMRRGWCEMEMYLWGNDQVCEILDESADIMQGKLDEHFKRTFEEDGA